MTELTFSALRKANVQRLPLFKNCHGKTAHSSNDGSDWSNAQWLEALVGEVGEYANYHKKFIRGDINVGEFNIAARKELADIAIYLDLLAFRLGFDLDAAVVEKFNTVSKRIGCDVMLPAAVVCEHARLQRRTEGDWLCPDCLAVLVFTGTVSHG